MGAGCPAPKFTRKKNSFDGGLWSKMRKTDTNVNVVTRHIRTFLLLSAALLLAACYNYDYQQIVEEEPVDILSRFNAEGKAWLSLEINLPEETSLTRTEFNDGDAKEYAVNSMKLVLFRGSSTATEDELTVASTYDVTYSPENDSHNQITTHSKVTIQITNNSIRTSDKLYLLVIANASPEITENATFSEVKDIMLTTAENVTPMTTKVGNTEYFVMTNAPLASANNGTGSVTTLVNVPSTFFFATEEEAEANPASQIYLERAAAKVTVTESVDPKTVLGNTDIDFETSDMKFGLYNYNDRSYIVRHFNGDWLSYNISDNYRFVENAPLPSGQYRTYWAQDVNYSGRDNIRTVQSWKGMNNSYYCAENTFNVASMQDNNTTSVVVRIRVNGANDFYTTSVTGSDVIYQLPANTVTEEGTSASESFSRRRSHKVESAKTIDEYLREWLMETNKDFRDWVRDYAAGEPRHVNITVERDERTSGGSGKVDAKVTAVTQTARASGTAGAIAFDNLELVDYFDKNITLNYYWQGYMFYRVPIRHFTDTETPWVSTATMTNNTTAQTYIAETGEGGKTAEQRYLGRFGVVRNNWYTINVRSVTHVGYPVIPSLSTDADDQVEQLLNATLKITGWEGNDIKL